MLQVVFGCTRERDTVIAEETAFACSFVLSLASFEARLGRSAKVGGAGSENCWSLKLDKLGETMRKHYVIPRISSSRYVRSNHLLVQRCVAAAHDQQSTARWSGWERGFGSHDLRLGFGVDPLKRQTCAKLKWAAERSTVVTVAPMHC